MNSDVDVQQIVAQLQRALGIRVRKGQITLNMADDVMQNYDYRVYGSIPVPTRAAKALDKRMPSGAY